MNACCCTKYSSGCLLNCSWIDWIELLLNLLKIVAWILLLLLCSFFIWLTHVSLCWLDCIHAHTYIYIALDLYRTYTLILTYRDVCLLCLQYALSSYILFHLFSLFFALHKLLISLWKLHKCRRSSNDSVLHHRSSVVTFVVLVACFLLLFVVLSQFSAPTSQYILQYFSYFSNLSRITKVNNLFLDLPIDFGHSHIQHYLLLIFLLS